MPFFISFLKISGLYDDFVASCPLSYTSPNAPAKRDVLGTLLMSILAGHHRYAHITSLRFDTVNPELLGMTRVISEDACVFRSKPATDSVSIRPGIPVEVGHRFRWKPATLSRG